MKPSSNFKMSSLKTLVSKLNTCALVLFALVSARLFSCLDLNKDVKLFSDEDVPKLGRSPVNEYIPFLGRISILNPKLLGFTIKHQEIKDIGTRILLSTSASPYGYMERKPSWYKFWAPPENCHYKIPEAFEFKNSNEQYDIDRLRNVLETLNYNPKARIVILIPGYLHQGTYEAFSWTSTAAKLWHQLDPDALVLQILWPGGANSKNYKKVVANSKIVARQVTIFLHYLAQLSNSHLRDFNLVSRVQMIGHSVGAHIAGFIGDELNGKIQRITGLDPAGPEFDDRQSFAGDHPIDELSLDRDDAQFVDILGTNIGFFGNSKFVVNWINDQIPYNSCNNTHKENSCFGNPKPLGHINYLANNGFSQPGCNNRVPKCDHVRANRIYLGLLDNAIKRKDRILAFNAESFDHLTNGSFHFSQNMDVERLALPIDVETLSANSFMRDLALTSRVSIYESRVNERAFFFPTTDLEPFAKQSYMIQINYNTAVWNYCDLDISLHHRQGEATKFLLKSEPQESVKAIVAVLAIESENLPEVIELKSNYRGYKVVSWFKRNECSISVKDLKLYQLMHQENQLKLVKQYKPTTNDDTIYKGTTKKFASF